MNEPCSPEPALAEGRAAAQAPLKQFPAENKADPALERHSRKCKICRHPDREDIEQDYRNWLHPSEIARDYQIDERALYRHLKGVGLAPARRENLRIILDRILERGAEKEISGNTIIKAVRAQCCLTDDNKWVEPARQVIHITEVVANQKEVEGSQNPNRQ